MIWIQFIISSALIVFAGTRLTTYADALSDRVDFGKVWVGVVLLGFVTSLPEAITSLTAVVSLQANDLAVGNMVGSNNFNLVLIFVMDCFYRQGAVTNAIPFNRSRVLPAFFAMGLAGIVMVSIFSSSFIQMPVVGMLGLGGLLILVIYV